MRNGLITLAITFVLVFTHTALGQSPTKEQLLEVANGIYTAFQDKDDKRMQVLTTHDFTFVGRNGLSSETELNEFAKSCTSRSSSWQRIYIP